MNPGGCRTCGVGCGDAVEKVFVTWLMACSAPFRWVLSCDKAATRRLCGFGDFFGRWDCRARGGDPNGRGEKLLAGESARMYWVGWRGDLPVHLR